MTAPHTYDLTVDRVDFTELVRPGDTVLWTQGAGEPLPLIERLLDQRHEIGQFSVLLGSSFAHAVRPEHADCISFTALGAVGTSRAMCAAGVVDLLPCHLSDIPPLIAAGVLRVDVVITQLSQRARTGELSFSTVNGYVGSALPTARVVIAEVNDQAPWTYSRYPIDRQQIDVTVRTSRPLVQSASRPSSATDLRIAERVVDLVPDGSVVQLGIGAIPNAVATGLTRRRDIALHTGVIGDAIVDLIESGAVTNAHKPVDPGVSVTGGLIGTQRLFDFAHENLSLRVDPVTYTHDPELLRQLPRFTAINSALEVDLTGQVGAEVAGDAYVGIIGGQVDFARGALSADGGRSIIALPARTASSRSRIVARIESGVVTTARSDADLVVTEYGTAELRGRSIPDRVRRLIAIAHPDDREPLERQAHDLVVGYR